ncbi:hypothetical protein CHUAL_003345 [Chamberlinius hualienensis]
MDDALKDERFKHIVNDPRFRSLSKNQRKVKIDNRFHSMFSDKQFKVKYSVDKRGRPESTSTDEKLRKYYELSSSEDESDDDESKSDNKAHAKSDDESENDEEKEIDYARGDGNLESSSSSEAESSDEEDDEVVHPWGELDNTERTDQMSRRLAVCNLDWDRIAAQDIYFLCRSFTPVGGVIKSVKVYLSEYGRKRLEMEEVNGPAELTENNECVEEGVTSEGDTYQMEKLRQYQLNRLNYYYAVIDCDSVETAAKLYDECDGLEFESSATKVDMRFIPDDMEFNEEPHGVADIQVDASSYRPKYFTTTALQSSNVHLTWDETNPDRTEVIQRAFDKKEEEDMDLKIYLASSSEDEYDEPQPQIAPDNKKGDKISKYKALLQNIEEEEKKKLDKDVHMEISWGVGLKEKTEELVKKKLNKKEELTPWEKYLDKKKEKKRQKKQNKAPTDNEEEEKSNSENEYSDDEVPSDVDLNDPYFKEEFESEKKGKEIKKKKQKNKNGKPMTDNAGVEDDEQKKAELSLLLMDDEDVHKKHYNLKKLVEEAKDKKKKKKSKQKETSTVEDDFKMNVEDSRFGAMYTSHLYNIDPSDPQFKKTKGIQQVMEEKQKRRINQDEDSFKNKKSKLNDEDDPQTTTVKCDSKIKEKAELSSLVKSIKNKAQSFNRNTKKKANKVQ